MSDKTEQTRHKLFVDLATVKAQRKHPRLLNILEDSLEEHLQALHVDHAELVASLQHTSQVYQDAYEQQKTLTRNACVYDRERYDELYQLRNKVEELEYNNELAREKLQEAIAKLASASLSIISLHRVIKTQQAAQDRLQLDLDRANLVSDRNKARYTDDLQQWATNYDEQWDANQVKQALIVEQREAIKTLVFELANARKAAVKPSFWSFLARKKHQAKPLPKKTH